MALQSKGAISISEIKTELGSARNSLRTLSSLAGKSTPDAMSEFYGYSNAAYVPIILGGAPFQEPEEACNVATDWGTNTFYYLETGAGYVGARLYYTESSDFPVDFEDSYWYFVDDVNVRLIAAGIVTEELFDCNG